MEVVPTETLSNHESNGKRKLKNKMPKRLRRRNKENNMKVAENMTNGRSVEDHESQQDREKQQESVVSMTVPVHSDPAGLSAMPNDVTSIDYWKYCVKKALDVLQKQASNRRILLIEQHQERVKSVQYLLHQREHIDRLIEQKESMSQLVDALRVELRTGQENLNIVQAKLNDRDDLMRDNDLLRAQLKLLEQKFERFTLEHSTAMEQCRLRENEQSEQNQSLLDEIERIKRDLVLENYRKQEIEKRARLFEERMKNEQNRNQKMQQDLIQMKQDLKSIHIKYDDLQIEMLAMHEANNNSNNDVLLASSNCIMETEWRRKRTINNNTDESQEIKRSKRKTRDRTQSCVSTASSSSGKRDKLATKSSKIEEDINSNSPPIVKRKTVKSSKMTKKHLPTVTITQASPSTDQALLSDKASSQLLLPPSASSNSDISDATDTSCESQSLAPRTKPSRYPRRRAQRPNKDFNISDQVKV